MNNCFITAQGPASKFNYQIYVNLQQYLNGFITTVCTTSTSVNVEQNVAEAIISSQDMVNKYALQIIHKNELPVPCGT